MADFACIRLCSGSFHQAVFGFHTCELVQQGLYLAETCCFAYAGFGACAHFGYYYDPTRATTPPADMSVLSPFAGDSMMLTVVAIVAVVIALILALVGKKQGKWMAYGAGCAVCALVAAIAIRVVFYQMGASVFMPF